MITKNFHQLKAEVQRHVEADQVAQGSYKTFFIGCLSGGVNNPAYIEREYGIPMMISRVAESIFEELSPGDAPEFFAAFPKAIGCNGKDLTRVGWKFLSAELRELLPVSAETQAVVAPVIVGMDLLAEGKKWHVSDSAAAWAAAWAANADSAANAALAAISFRKAALATNYAALAADSANFAARAFQATALADGDPILARRKQRDTLLQLIKEAPVTQEENS
jgi:hypothetical protein